MIAILLYLIGLISVVVTVVLAAFDAPALVQSLMAAYTSGLDAVLPALGRAAASLNWALMPFLGGLLLMGFARIMMLLGAIRHALKGPA
ncbi:MAG: hypothetical protein BGO82_11020 [Devosia sp. 67-54]|uniref:hypothetical protein n=1 Tax=unclassified Devosia TaxID=196773 RepID=UPI000961873A|nr:MULTISPECIES: hypothetical protein [unclassified Devosia]MBN9304831.1 hypothetical protein [Devosia sp.]OJX15213.1 MAG: hypothetical protein BGO82_11020 [Devosia sp. 67-54]